MREEGRWQRQLHNCSSSLARSSTPNYSVRTSQHNDPTHLLTLSARVYPLPNPPHYHSEEEKSAPVLYRHQRSTRSELPSATSSNLSPHQRRRWEGGIALTGSRYALCNAASAGHPSTALNPTTRTHRASRAPFNTLHHPLQVAVTPYRLRKNCWCGDFNCGPTVLAKPWSIRRRPMKIQT